MKLLPNSATRLASRSLLKINKSSPTLLVVAGVVGLGATAIMAARASGAAQPVIDQHKKDRAEIGYISKHATKSVRYDQQKQVVQLYRRTSLGLAKVYGPTIAVGTISAASVLYGHKILRGRHIATVAAYSGLMDQFNGYRERVAQTLGEKAERDIYNGAHGEWVEDPNHKGEYKLEPKYGELSTDYSYFRPWFDEVNVHHNNDPANNYMFLTGAQNHMNDILALRGHVFLNDVLDNLRMPRCREGAVMGWLYDSKTGDGHIDFGFMTGTDPDTVAFRDKLTPDVRLNFNIDDKPIWDQI